MRHPVLKTLVPLVAVTALAGCGTETINQKDAEDIARQVAGSGSVKLESLTCPSDVEPKKGKDFDCEVAYEDGATGTITMHQKDDKGTLQANPSDIKVSGGK